MARLRHPLWGLFSLLSFSFQFFLYSANAQGSPADFWSRISKLRNTEALLNGVLHRRQSSLPVRTNTGAKDCEGDAEESAHYLDHSQRLRLGGTLARKDDDRNASQLLASDDNNYVHRSDTTLSSLKTALFQWMRQDVLHDSTDSSAFVAESADISDDILFRESGDVPEEISRTTAKRADGYDGNSIFGDSRVFRNRAGRQPTLEGNEYEMNGKGEEDFIWNNPQDETDSWSDYLSLSAVTDMQVPDTKTSFRQDTDPAALSVVSVPPRKRDTSLSFSTNIPSPRLHSGRKAMTRKDDTPPAQAPPSQWLAGPGSQKLAQPLSLSKRPFSQQLFLRGHHDRRRVLLPQMRKFPFSNIARLSTGCTGTLVTPRHVLTAAHCVHNGLGFRNNLEKLKIEIPDTMGFKNYYAQKITVPTGWLRESRARTGGGSEKRAMYDYAVVHLTLSVAGRTRFLPLAVPRPEVLQMDFHFLAFPEDDQQLWRSVCLASQHMALSDGNLIMTRCDAAVGNSGAAVFIQDPNHGGLKVVGLLSNTRHVGHHRSFLRYSIITALTWPKLNHICQELDVLGQVYSVCPPVRYMRRPPPSPQRQQELQVIPFFGKRVPEKESGSGASSASSRSGTTRWTRSMASPASPIRVASKRSESAPFLWIRGPVEWSTSRSSSIPW